MGEELQPRGGGGGGVAGEDKLTTEWLVTALPLVPSRHLVLAQYRTDDGQHRPVIEPAQNA